MATAAPLAWRTPGAKSVQPRLRVDGRWLSSWPTRADAPWQRCDGAGGLRSWGFPRVLAMSLVCQCGCRLASWPMCVVAQPRTSMRAGRPRQHAARRGMVWLGCTCSPAVPTRHTHVVIYTACTGRREVARGGVLCVLEGVSRPTRRDTRELRLDRMGIRFEEAGFVLTHRATTSSSEIRGSPPGRRRDSIHACCL